MVNNQMDTTGQIVEEYFITSPGLGIPASLVFTTGEEHTQSRPLLDQHFIVPRLGP